MATNLPTTPPTDPPRHSWIYRKAVLPVVGLLRLGASPERLAWSLALGLLIGINPVLGSTTLACLVCAFILRLNLVSSQITNHLVYPLQIALFLPFLHLGSWLFQAPAVPLSPSHLLHMARTRPIALSRELWTWEWHALVAWFLIALFAVPLLALSLTQLLRRLAARVERREYPLVPAIVSGKPDPDTQQV